VLNAALLTVRIRCEVRALADAAPGGPASRVGTDADAAGAGPSGAGTVS
jgi:hypothetical protein